MPTNTRAYAQAAEPGNFFAAGKNKFINGDFNINQRGFSSTTTDQTYMFDRWTNRSIDGTTTWSAQTFTPGSAPVAGYEGKNYLQVVTTGQTLSTARSVLRYNLEDVRTLADRVVTVSFWAKAASGTPSVAFCFFQSPGVSADVSIPFGKVTLSTSWARYSLTGTIPSLSGKTLSSTSSSYLDFFVSAGSNSNTNASNLGIQSNTFSFWGMQIEEGSVATPFQTATGTLAGELAACQRYYYLAVSGTDKIVCSGYYVSATQVNMFIPFPVTMRTAPTLVATSGTDYYFIEGNGSNDAFNGLTIYRPTQNAAQMYVNSNVSGTAGYAGNIQTNNASASVAFNSEL